MLNISKAPSIFYKIFLLAILPFALLYTIYRSMNDGGIRYLIQRIGIFSTCATPSILIHCASVGEVNAAKPLLFELLRINPECKVTVSTNTPTGASIVNNLNTNNISHIYLPLDYKPFVNSLFNRIKPICILIFETEIWPNLYYLAANKNTPIAIINGRLSTKTTNANYLVANEYKRSLKNLTLLLTRSDQDTKLYLKLGSNESTTHTVGNLKYASLSSTQAHLPCTTIKRPFFLAASTHEDEELQITQHIKILKRKDYLLVIAPRYPDRCTKLAQELKNLKLNVSIRSQKNEITKQTDIYIVDTLGELNMFYNEAALVFVGGSLIQRGGHNILEPANYGKCIIVGPNTDNFCNEVKELLNANGIIQVKDIQNLGVKLVQLLNNDEERLKIGKNAQTFIKEKKEILQSYMNYIQPMIHKK